MKLLGKLTLLLGGLLIITTLQACGPADPSVSNRTIEQHNLEKEFQPLFDFLAQEKKDFSEVSMYKSNISERTLSSEDQVSYKIELEKKNQIFSGNYRISEAHHESDYAITMDDAGGLTYLNPVPKEYEDYWKDYSIKSSFFKELKIYDSTDHPKTYLKSIGYKVDNVNEYLNMVKEKYQLSNDTKITIALMKSYGEDDIIYDADIIFEDGKHIVSLYTAISFEGEEK